MLHPAKILYDRKTKILKVRLFKAIADKPYTGQGRRILNPNPKAKAKYKYIYNEEKYQAKQQKQLTQLSKRDEIVKKGTPWHNRMMPSERDYNAMQNGDANAMANYLMTRFWEKTGETGEGNIMPSPLVRSLPRTWTGDMTYSVEDLNQELAVRMLNIISKKNNVLKRIPINEFPTFLVKVYKNIGAKLAEKARAQKRGGGEQSAYTEISEVAHAVESASQDIQDQLNTKEMKLLLNKFVIDRFKGLSERDQKIVRMHLDGFRHDEIIKKLKKSYPGINQNVIRTVYKRKISQPAIKMMQAHGYLKDAPNPTKYIKPVIRKFMLGIDIESEKKEKKKKVLTLKEVKGRKKAGKKKSIRKKIVNKASFFVDKFGRIFLKAQYRRKAVVGGDTVYDYGPKDPRTDSYFKQQYAKQKPGDDLKQKPKKEDGTQSTGNKTSEEEMSFKDRFPSVRATESGGYGFEDKQTGEFHEFDTKEDAVKGQHDYLKKNNIPIELSQGEFEKRFPSIQEKDGKFYVIDTETGDKFSFDKKEDAVKKRKEHISKSGVKITEESDETAGETKEQTKFQNVKEAIKKSLKQSLSGVVNVLKEAYSGGSPTGAAMAEAEKQAGALKSVQKVKEKVQVKPEVK